MENYSMSEGKVSNFLVEPEFLIGIKEKVFKLGEDLQATNPISLFQKLKELRLLCIPWLSEEARKNLKSDIEELGRLVNPIVPVGISMPDAKALVEDSYNRALFKAEEIWEEIAVLMTPHFRGR
jgi:hypothetical protein